MFEWLGCCGVGEYWYCLRGGPTEEEGERTANFFIFLSHLPFVNVASDYYILKLHHLRTGWHIAGRSSWLLPGRGVLLCLVFLWKTFSSSSLSKRESLAGSSSVGNLILTIENMMVNSFPLL